jgi:tape measure domain-containing protein
MQDSLLKLVLQAVDNASGPLKEVTKALDGVDKKNSILGTGFGFLENVAVASLKAIGIAAFVTASTITTMGIKTAANLETTEIGFKTLLGSADKAGGIMKRIKDEAQRTPFEVPGLSSATQLLTSITKDGNKALNAILDIGEGLAAMGKGQVELDRIIVNMQQIGAVGHASMVDIKQFAFNGIPIFEMLQKETGKTGEGLSKFISDGGVSFDLLVKMFDKANDAGGPFFEAYKNQLGSFDQLFSNAKDSISLFSADLVQQTGIFDLAKQGLSLFTKAVTENKQQIIDLAKNGVEFLKENFEKLQPGIEFLRNNTDILKGALTGVGVAIATSVIPFIVTLGSVFLAAAAPVFLLIGAVTLLYLAYQRNLYGIKDIVDNSIKYIVETVWPKLVEAFAYFKDQVLPKLIELWETKLYPAFLYLSDVIVNELWPALQNLWTKINELWVALQNLWNLLSPILIPVFIFIASVIGVVLFGAILLVIKVVTLLTIAFEFVLSVVTSVVGGIVYYWNYFKWIFEGVINFIKTSAESGTRMIREFFEKAVNFIVDKLNNAKETASSSFNQMSDSAGKLPGKISEFFEQIKNQVTEKITQAVNSVKDKFREIGKINLFSTGSEIIEGLIKGLNSKLGDLKSVANSIGETIKNLPSSAGKFVSEAIPGRATGGIVNEPFTLVGERGPEIVSLPTGSRVHTASQTKSMLSSKNSGSSTINYITFSPTISGNMNPQELFEMFESWLAEKNLLTNSIGI